MLWNYSQRSTYQIFHVYHYLKYEKLISLKMDHILFYCISTNDYCILNVGQVTFPILICLAEMRLSM